MLGFSPGMRALGDVRRNWRTADPDIAWGSEEDGFMPPAKGTRCFMEEESLFKADAVNEEDPERDRATQV